MKVIFLDFDGPLIPARAFPLHPGGLWTEPCRTSGALINELAQRADAQLVISSTWRRTDGYEGCKDLLRKAGIDLTRLHKDWATKELDLGGNRTREDEIQAWVDEHEGVEAFIAIDDMALGKLPDAHKVNTTTRNGFLLEHYEEACEKLGIKPYDGVMLFW